MKSLQATMMPPIGGCRLLAVAALIAWISAAQTQTDALAGIGRKPDTPQRIEWIRKNAIAVRSIDPGDADFTDLDRMKERIGAARIVLLGFRSTVNRAPQFAGERLVHYLHERLGFDVLALPASFFDAERLNTLLERSESVSGTVLSEIFSRTAPGMSGPQTLVDYAQATRRTGHALEVAGYEFHVSEFTRKEYAASLFEFLDRTAPKAASAGDRKTVARLVTYLAPRRGVPPRPSEKQRAAMARLAGKLTGDDPETAFYRRSLENLAMAAAWAGRYGAGMQKPLGENLVWMATKRYPQRKIVVWAPAFMAVRQPSTLTVDASFPMNGPGPTLATGGTLGDALDSEYHQQAYLIGFTTPGMPQFPGWAGFTEPSLEHLFERVGKPYLLLDLRSAPQGHWLREPLGSGIVGPPVMSTWPSNFDAVFYTDPGAAK